MIDKNAVRQRIINLSSKNELNPHQLSVKSGVPYSTIRSYIAGNENSSITLTTLLHLCEGYEISLKDFFDDPLFKTKTKQKIS